MQQGPENLFASSLSIAVLGPAATPSLLVAGCASVNTTNHGYLAVTSSSKIATLINQTPQLTHNARGYRASPGLLRQRHPKGAHASFLGSQRSSA